MKKSVGMFTAVALLSGVVALAAPPTDSKKDTKKVAKVTDVWTCPMTSEKIKDHKSESGKPVVVGSYRVHFCCGGCPESFAKLSDKDKLAKATAAAKLDAKPAKKS